MQANARIYIAAVIESRNEDMFTLGDGEIEVIEHHENVDKPQLQWSVRGWH